ncbi:MAG: SusC/RagA family TonB-linked outer membrane protein [Hydrotalea flava]|uniref:SusC/RagA family TonB-linked outer membrane protein n=1 Tax=Hydrotalea lipotrueae TaxID=2803817 RepID=UPI001690D70C|nr:SusC/RagA family TonB-linked outer membrane protein [Hydrotalea lipotrueae]NIM35290.1 SusC/RagA family TonB-linked outer membrane protein [Hydrotalea flava]NIM38149.1 SusC/RagA family TonB-linked outer membrane protein [Hydrotalea flava]NIN03313.1 SusC/RagA family TonB-linked outer membrane protein [Hydrotalea flava]NIN15007.1 SusC/RagA family TonB-linked outer membrane protein [Hydrotalea flava]NIO94075.1 SusC/RagA family TonB-linked outer membrane protein [Hydrotalea flava]
MKKIGTLVCILLSVCFTAFSQISTRQIKGKVVGEDNEPLAGASVVIAGSKKGVQTDNNGNFTLSVLNDGDKNSLLISYVGYATKTVDVHAAGNISVHLTRTNDAGNEVVVIGYQTVKRKDLLASVSSVGAKDLKDIPINSAAEALAGRLAGVQITSSEGSPDANITIRVRGGGSITQDNSPLYIVDGVQIENALASLAPQDIQSIDVLKDAAATAIYGARGANGVVIITTKGGRQGKLRMSYNGFIGLEKLAKELPVMSPWEFIRWNYERSRSNSTDSATFAKTYGTTWDTLSVYKSIAPVDWQKLVLGRNGMMQSNNVSVNGGNSKTTFNLSYTNNTDKTVVLNSNYYRNLINLRVDQRIGKKIRMSATFRYLNQNVYGAGTSSPNGSTYNRLRNTVKYRPFLSPNITTPDVIDPSLVDNSTGNGLFLVNPIALSNAEYRKKSTDGLNISGYVSYQITKNLTFRSTFGYDYNHYINRQYSDSISPVSIIQGGAKPVVELDTSNRTSINNSNVFTYSLKNLGGKHDIDVLLGQETYQVRTESTYDLFKNIPTFTPIDKAFNDLSLGTSFTGYPKQIITKYTSLSFFERINYVYEQKYTIE